MGLELAQRQRNHRNWNEFIERTYPQVRKFQFRDIPEESDRFVVMVEPREHPHLEYVLRNVMHFLGPAWGLQLFVGRKNKAFVKDIVKDWNKVHVAEIGTDNLTAAEYNQLKKTPGFWELIKGEHVLWIEPDCLLCHGEVDPFLEYDYVGAPWDDWMTVSGHVRIGNGGLSLRRKSAMIEIGRTCNRDASVFQQEDVFYSVNMHLQPERYRLPALEVAQRFAVETIYHPNPLGLHKAWKFIPSGQFEMLLDTIRYDR